jgi:DNA primase
LDAAAFTAPAYAVVAAAATAAGGAAAATPGEGWVCRVRDGCTDDPARSLVTELAVEPVRTTGEPDERYASTLLARLEELHATRRIAQLKSRLQRLNPVEQPEVYNKLFGDLVALEQHRHVLREKAIGDL